MGGLWSSVWRGVWLRVWTAMAAAATTAVVTEAAEKKLAVKDGWLESSRPNARHEGGGAFA